MNPSVHGIHHVTCFSGDAQENVNFFVGTLGLRLVKRSVNQDAPSIYHLFYADGAGTPGTDITFFPRMGMGPARLGTGLTVEIPFAVPPGSLGYWQDRFEREGVPHEAIATRFGEKTLPFKDPEGLALSLVETDDEREFVPWPESPVPEEHQLRGMHTVRLLVRRLGPSEQLLTSVLGFSRVGDEDGWVRYGVDGGASGALIELKELPNEPRGRWGSGGVHHVAWRARDSEEELALRARVAEAGLNPSPQIDRFWFKSVYFEEPGGVVFEIATDGPGFGVDEDPEHLGETLVLPPWLEPQRRQIEAGLPPLTLP